MAHRTTLLAIISLLLASFAHGQTIGGGSITVFAGVPSGSCLAPQQAVNSSNGNLYTCTASAWTLVSGGGGLGTATNTQILYDNAGTVGGFGTFNNSTLATTLPGSLATGSDGVHPSSISLFGNTTAPTLAANTFSIVGPNVTSFTAYALQFPNAAPAANTLLCLGAPSSAVSQAAYCNSVTNLTLVTPALGTPASVVLTNATGLPEGGLSTTDITTNNVSTSKHGFAPKGDANAAHYLDGTGAYSTPTGSGTVTHTAGSLTLNAVMLGNATADSKVSTGITTDGSRELDVGIPNSTSGVLGMLGLTAEGFNLSGRVGVGIPIPYITSRVNPSVVAFDVFPRGAPSDQGATTGVAWNDICSTDIINDGTNYECLRLGKWSTGTNSSAVQVSAAAGGTGTVRNMILQLNGGGVAIGTTSAPTAGGLLSNTSLTATTSVSGATYKTATNCAAVGTAASPSVASCGSAAAGHFSCATNATGATCTVNTTAVTANSEIFVFDSDTAVTGTALGVTCNTSTAVDPTGATLKLLASSVAATSFTINLGTVTTNPACFSYHIVN